VQTAHAGDLDAVLGRYPAAVSKDGHYGTAPQPRCRRSAGSNEAAKSFPSISMEHTKLGG
jgi:hypothetical protein